MKLSKRGEYGLKALIDLASQDDPQTLIQIRDIAQRQKIPVKFLEQIMLAMKNGGILHSRAGIGGGYYLARPANEITLGQVVRLLDGPLAPIACVSQMAYERCVCADEATCGLRLAMLDVRNAIADILDKTTLADVSTRVERAQRAGRRPVRHSAKRPTAQSARR
ncbi:MAG TPA: Rrf2 family transcriptional regulator [Anaerolineae bacterium]|nr:Rrf2 family transcriptional regulator [Anaerolineae bacterium]